VAVEAWVLMNAATTPISADDMCAGTKRNYGSSIEPSTPSVKRPTNNNSTIVTPTSIIRPAPDPDDCHTLHQEFLILSSFNPDLLQHGKRLVNGVDLDCQLFWGMIHESVKLCTKLNEALQFQYQHDKHGIWLIKLPISKSNRGIVTPNMKKCMDEVLLVFDDNDDDGAHDIVVDVLLDYLVKSNRTALREKLHEQKMVPKVMDGYSAPLY
jgi:hypothetical protein